MGKRHVIKIIPCPDYDVEGTESWLSEMALQGLQLKKDGFFAGFAAFEQCGPQKARYRLEAARKSTSIWSDNGGEPDPEAVEINWKYDWEYVAKRGQFHIYRSTCADGRELNTDPEVQALALNEVRKRQRNNLIGLLFWLIIYPVIVLKGLFFLFILDIGSGFFFFQTALVAFLIMDEAVELHHLSGLKRKLKNGESLDHAKDWKRKQYFYLGKTFLATILIVLWVYLLLHNLNISTSDEDAVALKEYTETIPFATLKDLAGNAVESYGSEFDDMNMNYVKEWSDWLSPVNYKLSEHAAVRLMDGNVLAGGLYVDYHEAFTEFLAEQFAAEYYRMDKVSKNFKEMDCPELGVDYAAAYYDELHFPTVIMRQGNTVIHASFYQTSEYQVPFEEWTGILAGSIRQENN